MQFYCEFWGTWALDSAAVWISSPTFMQEDILSLKESNIPKPMNWHSVLILRGNYDITGKGILLKNMYVLETYLSHSRCRNFWAWTSVTTLFLFCGHFRLTYKSCLLLVFSSLDQERSMKRWNIGVSWVLCRCLVWNLTYLDLPCPLCCCKSTQWSWDLCRLLVSHIQVCPLPSLPCFVTTKSLLCLFCWELKLLLLPELNEQVVPLAWASSLTWSIMESTIFCHPSGQWCDWHILDLRSFLRSVS